MTPSLREKWNTVPRDYQKFWVDRERDMQIKMQETSDERKLASEFNQIVAPYADMFRQHGTNAVAHAKELFNLDNQLRSGSGADKARIIHGLITHFKPDAQTLTQLFTGAQPTQQQQAPSYLIARTASFSHLAASFSASFLSSVLVERSSDTPSTILRQRQIPLRFIRAITFFLLWWSSTGAVHKLCTNLPMKRREKLRAFLHKNSIAEVKEDAVR